jgi:hypothetical protein
MYNTSVSEEPAVCIIMFLKNIGTYLPGMPSLPRGYYIFNRVCEIQLLMIINRFVVYLLVFGRLTSVMHLQELQFHVHHLVASNACFEVSTTV